MKFFKYGDFYKGLWWPLIQRVVSGVKKCESEYFLRKIARDQTGIANNLSQARKGNKKCEVEIYF